ncbi:MAG: Hpt domain-containing protein [Fuerstiella sp.]
MADNTEEMSEDDELLAAFVDESLELLQDLPASLESYTADRTDTEQINSIFRAVHSIKGNAGFFGLAGIKQFAHSLENTLDEVRGGTIDLNERLARAFIDGFDILDGLLNRALEREVAELGGREKQLLQEIAHLTANSDGPVDPMEVLVQEILALSDVMANADEPDVERWVEQLHALCSDKS